MSRFGAVRRTKIMPETQTWFNNCHASSIVKTGAGDFLCAFMGGEREEAPDLAIWLSRRENSVWRDPVRIKGEYGLPHWNPVLHRDGDRVWLFYKVGNGTP